MSQIFTLLALCSINLYVCFDVSSSVYNYVDMQRESLKNYYQNIIKQEVKVNTKIYKFGNRVKLMGQPNTSEEFNKTVDLLNAEYSNSQLDKCLSEIMQTTCKTKTDARGTITCNDQTKVHTVESENCIQYCPNSPALSTFDNIESFDGCESKVTNDTCSFNCNENYKAVGNFVVNEKHEWYESDDAACKPVCPSAPEIKNADIESLEKCKGLFIGKNCTVLCLPGFIATGIDPYCTEENTWNTTSFFCHIPVAKQNLLISGGPSYISASSSVAITVCLSFILNIDYTELLLNTDFDITDIIDVDDEFFETNLQDPEIIIN